MPDEEHDRSSREVSWRQRIIPVLAAVALVLLIVVRVQQRLQPPPKAPARPLAVKVLKLAPAPFAVSRTYTGTLVAADRVVISAELTGRVRSVPYLEGQAVRRGDLLAVLDDTEERKEIRRLAAGLAALENQEDLRPTMRGFKIANAESAARVRAAMARVTGLETQRATIPTRVPVQEVVEADVIKLSVERKHLTDILKMVAYQAEGEILRLLSLLPTSRAGGTHTDPHRPLGRR